MWKIKNAVLQAKRI